jgi:hypothetical protein
MPETRLALGCRTAAGIANRPKIAPGVGREGLSHCTNLLDLMCLEVQLTSQLGHNRPGSEQYFAYAISQRPTVVGVRLPIL